MYFRASVFWELSFLEGVFRGDVRDPQSNGYKSLFIESIFIVIRYNLQIGFPQNPIFLMNLNFKRKGSKSCTIRKSNQAELVRRSCVETKLKRNTIDP